MNDLHHLLEQALAGEADFDATWERLDAALAAAPDDVDLLRGRIRLAEAAGLLGARIDALRRLVAVAPDDREARLDLALTQHRRAYFLVDDELDEEAQQAELARLQAEAEGWFDALVAEHLADADFMARLFAAEHGPLQAAPWRRLRRLLEAQAAAPAHAGLGRLLALAWCDMAGRAPSNLDDSGKVPMGFLCDPFGNLFEPLMIERALAALAPLLQAAPRDIELLAQRAQLSIACGRYADAAVDHEAIAAAWDERAAADADARAEALEAAEQARGEAERCRRGRSAVVEASLGGLEDLIAQLGRFQGDQGDQGDDDSAARRDELQAEFETNLRPQVEAMSSEPDAAALAELDEIAAQVAARSHGLLTFEPVELVPFDGALPDRWLAETGAQFEAAGWRHVGFCENPVFSARFGVPVICGLWTDPAGTSIAAATVAGALRVLDLESEFEGGLQLITTASRGRSNYGGGPGCDQIAVDADVPPTELAALHRARVAQRLALAPQQRALTIDSVAAFAAMQERQRRGKLAWRLAEGIGEYEALGMPNDHLEHFVPRVRRAIAEEFARVARASGL